MPTPSKYQYNSGMEFATLRHQHPRFSYDSYQATVTPEGLAITHFFTLEPKIEFQAQVVIESVTAAQWKAVPAVVREQWLFHLGLAELPSYWKAAASPQIVIQAGWLNQAQLAWWNKLLIKGMGEYFYQNQIDFTTPDFVKWVVETKPEPTPQERDWTKAKQGKPMSDSQYLVPIGGGKDSALTACLLSQHQRRFDAFLLNPTPAMTQVTQLAQPAKTFIARRTIDPQLLELNNQGYLNGHVPFSAYLACLASLIKVIARQQSVVISNEHSSNEGNIEFLGQEINHQYSKSFAFEQDFVQYLVTNQLVPPTEQSSYFSLLRPWYELQISQRFAKCDQFEQYATAFRSCNRGQKTNSWCGECSKCLFTFTSLYPFIKQEQLVKIFGQDLFANPLLIDLALALMGKTETKPFECVGTHEESIAAFYLSVTKARSKTTNQAIDNASTLPPLLQLVWNRALRHEENLAKRTQQVLAHWNKNHQLPGSLVNILKTAKK